MMREETDEEIVREAIWSELRAGERALAALGRLVAQRNAAVSQLNAEMAFGEEWRKERLAALARAEAAEKEAEMYRREAAHARTLASGWAEANAERSRAEAAEKERDAEKQTREEWAREAKADIEAAEARCATLEAALTQALDEIDKTPYATKPWGFGIAFRIMDWRRALAASPPAEDDQECPACGGLCSCQPAEET